jgi:hypothetical protein
VPDPWVNWSRFSLSGHVSRLFTNEFENQYSYNSSGSAIGGALEKYSSCNTWVKIKKGNQMKAAAESELKELR